MHVRQLARSCCRPRSTASAAAVLLYASMRADSRRSESRHKERPMLLEPSGDAAVVAGGSAPAIDPTKTGRGREPGKPKKPRSRRARASCRGFIIALTARAWARRRGNRRLTYQQFTPGPVAARTSCASSVCDRAVVRGRRLARSRPGDLRLEPLHHQWLAESSTRVRMLAALTAAYDVRLLRSAASGDTGLAERSVPLARRSVVRVGKRRLVAVHPPAVRRRQQVVHGKIPNKLASDSLSRTCAPPTEGARDVRRRDSARGREGDPGLFVRDRNEVQVLLRQRRQEAARLRGRSRGRVLPACA